MNRCVLNVATGRYVQGQKRLAAALKQQVAFLSWTDCLPTGSPAHRDVPYAFKAWALRAAEARDYSLVLWADASILPNQPIVPLLERIEREGYWISRNGWTNAQWTAGSAYEDLGVSPEENATIPHVVATAFGLNLQHPIGRTFYVEYLRLAQTRAFCGPWWNSNHPEYGGRDGAAPCGSPDVCGHRHDQTAASVIAWRLQLRLTDPPDVFAYRGGETEATILVADGAY